MKNKKLRILVVEDDKIDRMAIERHAANEHLSYNYTFAGSIQEADEVLEKEEFDAVLLDYMLGDGTAFDLFQRVQKTPFIIVTGTGDEEVAVNAMKCGACDYLIKDNEGNYLKTLTMTIDNAIKRKRAEEELHEYREHLEELVQQRTVKMKAEIEERRKVEEELMEARDQLEKRVQERTVELQKINHDLQKEITSRKKIEKQIKASLNEKEVLLKEIHHRVKNNLQVISSLLNLQARQISDKQTFGFFQECQNRVRTMALIHEKLYQSSDLTRIDFAEYINSLVKGLYLAYHTDPNKVKLHIKAENIAFSVGLAVPCGLIINELVSNALKYAFPVTWRQKGEITISLSKGNINTIRLSIKDNGIGLPANFKKKDQKSLGLQLVTLLAEEQLSGTLTLNRKKGTQFIITFNVD